MTYSTEKYDIAFIGNYTKDTIISASGTRVVDGGACNYGANVAARMGLTTAVVTRLAQEDIHVVDALRELDIDVFARITPQSTCLRLEYPTSNLDERVIYVTSSAGAFTPTEVERIQSRAFLIGASMRGEVGLDVIQELGRKDTILAADVQSFIRVERDGILTPDTWPKRERVMAHLNVLKTDAVEAKLLTGDSDIKVAAKMIADMGPSEIVLTHRDGLLVYANGQFHEAGFFPIELVGRSGRGDTSIAAYVAKRLTASPAEAAVWAAAVVSLKMEAEGPFRREMSEVEDLIRTRYSSQTEGATL